jgi:diguanylate cyclase (GGDEF)-like protein
MGQRIVDDSLRRTLMGQVTGGPELTLSWHGFRVMTASLTLSSAVVLGVIWSWGGGFLVAALAIVAITDALYRRRHPATSSLLSTTLDVTLIGTAMVVVQLEPIGIGAPFIYMLVVPAILLPWKKAWYVMAYAVAWSGAALIGWEIVPLTQAVSPMTITVIAYVIFAGHTVALVVVVSGALGRWQRAAERVEEQMKHLAGHDPLTGLANRALLSDRIEIALADARRSGQHVAVVFIDLDHFKRVNDSAGHAGGDEVLVLASYSIAALVRDGDSVARVGGDEFVMLLTRITSLGEAAKIAERVVGGLRQTWRVAGREIRITASAGIAIYPDDGGDAESLLEHADRAMYRAKGRGRDTFQLFSAAMNLEVEERAQLESDLRIAIDRDEFVLHYQPQADSGSQQIVGVEALLRWNHPERGRLWPEAFIGIAEDSGLILPIGDWVLATACAQRAAWAKAGIGNDMPVTVNISRRQFHDAKLVNKVNEILHETGLDPAHLELEISESAAMDDLERSVRTLDDLNRIGVGASIDDFGAGYSSLSSLRRLQVQRVKIDNSLVRGVAEDPDSAAVMAATISLADILGLDAIAEGVETVEQLAFLTERQCPTYQGYLFSEPLTTSLLESLLAESDTVVTVSLTDAHESNDAVRFDGGSASLL